MSKLDIRKVDFHNEKDAADLLMLLQNYALDPDLS